MKRGDDEQGGRRGEDEWSLIQWLLGFQQFLDCAVRRGHDHVLAVLTAPFVVATFHLVCHHRRRRVRTLRRRPAWTGGIFRHQSISIATYSGAAKA